MYRIQVYCTTIIMHYKTSYNVAENPKFTIQPRQSAVPTPE